jgi:mRNA-degrading endonuclease RelE of RelBE toxin-antitoxin system
LESFLAYQHYKKKKKKTKSRVKLTRRRTKGLRSFHRGEYRVIVTKEREAEHHTIEEN